MWRVLIPVVVTAGLLVPAPGAGRQPSPQEQLAISRAGNVLTTNADGTGARLLLRDAYSPAWSPDGSKLAFVSRRAADEEIYVANANGTGVRRLTRSAGPDLSPAWSGDGRRIAFSRNSEIWTMRVDGSLQRPLVRRPKPWHEHYTPTWHVATIAYSSNRVSAFNAELYAVPATRLTFTKGSDGVLGDDGMPDFSPDGRRIAFTSNRDQNGEIYVMNANGIGQKRLTRTPTDDFTPRFSPDGRRIVFVSLPGTIQVMNADGSGLRRLTSGTDADWRP